MPPKASKKTVEKQKQKSIEDKTFGLKNKNKSTKVQKYVQNVAKTVNDAGEKKKKAAGELPKKSKAELEAEKKAELAQLFKVTQAPVKPGVDPKSVVCEFFKMGMCTKGDKCKFSHDLFVARKAEKIDIYTDRRDLDGAKNDDMESGNWDQKKLEEVVSEKEKAHSNRPVTDIICKYFLEALELKKYGWFWSCPNGDKCQYRHALPPGYVLKEKSKKEDEPEEEKTPLEELIEQERKKLTTRTPVTKENFEKWRADKAAKKKLDAEEAEKKRKADLKAGRTPMSGKEMFAYHPELFVDDDEAFQADDYINNNPDEAGVVPEIVVTATGTSITLTRKERPKIEDGALPPEVENADLFNADEIPDDIGDEEDGDGKDDEDDEDEDEDEEPVVDGKAEKAP